MLRPSSSSQVTPDRTDIVILVDIFIIVAIVVILVRLVG